MRARHLFAAVSAAVLETACGAAVAQAYPSKPVRFVVPYTPGGGTDLMARALAQRMSESMGQSVIVENRAGAGGNVGTEMVARAEPDGYTLLATAPGPLAINRYLFDRLSFDPDAFTPVSVIYANVSALSIHPKSQLKSLSDLIAFAKANPGKLNYSSVGLGSTQHLTGEALKAAGNLDIVHVPYKGSSEQMVDLLGGREIGRAHV